LTYANSHSRAETARHLINQMKIDVEKEINRRFYIIEDIFTSDHATVFRNIPGLILYISDIRTDMADFNGQRKTSGTAAKNPADLDILVNNAYQHIWIHALRPAAALLKFRVPFWEPGSIEEVRDVVEGSSQIEFYANAFAEYKRLFSVNILDDYVNGRYRWVRAAHFDLQAFPGNESAETRAVIMAADINTIELIDCKQYEEKMSAYNTLREFVYCAHNEQYFNKMAGLDGCLDCDIAINAFIAYFKKAGTIGSVNVSGAIINCLDSFKRKILELQGPQIHGDFFRPFDPERALLYNAELEARTISNHFGRDLPRLLMYPYAVKK